LTRSGVDRDPGGVAVAAVDVDDGALEGDYCCSGEFLGYGNLNLHRVVEAVSAVDPNHKLKIEFGGWKDMETPRSRGPPRTTCWRTMEATSGLCPLPVVVDDVVVGCC